MTRKELIKLCEDAVVHHTKWGNRDSYIAQKGIQSIYLGLTAGCKYRVVTNKIDPDYHSNDRTLIIQFTHDDQEKLKDGKHLKISSRENYHTDCDPDYQDEMFDGDGIDFYSNFRMTFMPTRKRLEEVGVGNDWY